MTLDDFKKEFAGKDRKKVIELAYEYYVATAQISAGADHLSREMRTLQIISDYLVELLEENNLKDKLTPEKVSEYVNAIIEERMEGIEVIGKSIATFTSLAIKADRTQNASDGGRAKDNKSGNEEKRRKIRLAWASGKYSSRDICAEQECAALGMSFSTARKALRGTPDPISRS